MAADLRVRSFEGRLPIPALWFGHLDLDFGISDPGVVGKETKSLIASLADGTDGHTIVNLWRMASRAFHLAKKDSDQHRSQSEAAEQLVRMAGQQPMAMLFRSADRWLSSCGRRNRSILLDHLGVVSTMGG